MKPCLSFIDKIAKTNISELMCLYTTKLFLNRDRTTNTLIKATLFEKLYFHCQHCGASKTIGYNVSKKSVLLIKEVLSPRTKIPSNIQH